MAEKAYLELAKRYSFETIECSENAVPLSKEIISDKVYKKVKNLFK